jgi:hypothetical protein
MDDLIERLVTNIGVDKAVAEKAVGIIFQFLLKEGPTAQVKALLDQFPNSDKIIASAPPDTGAMSLFGGGVVAAGSRMMGLGLSMGQVQSITRETITFAREQAGEDVVGQIVGAIPGLGQYI